MTPRYILVGPDGSVIDWRYGGLPALTLKRDRLNLARPGHRIVVQWPLPEAQTADRGHPPVV